MLHCENLRLYLRLGLNLKIKKNTLRIRIQSFNQSQWLKPYVEFNTQKRIEAQKKKKKKKKKNGTKNEKALSKLMNNAAYDTRIQNFRNRNDVKLVSNKKNI